MPTQIPKNGFPAQAGCHRALIQIAQAARIR
jgi:hypothetical protein